MKKQKITKNKTQILFRYGLITFVFVLLAAAIAIRLFRNTVIEAEAWNQRARKELAKVSVIPPERGSLLASNGSILACNLKVYDIKIDFRHNKILSQKTVPWEKVDSLADSLDFYYPKHQKLTQNKDTFNKYSWHTILKKELDKPAGNRARALKIAGKKTLDDFEKIRNFPYFKDFKGDGTKIPVYKIERNVRIYPYGRMAYRSIGRVNEDEKTREFHGYSGLEKDLDSLLYGKPGESKKVAMNSGFTDWVSKPAVRGFDIQTTIDIDMQDMLEEELHKVCESIDAEWGTAILMEVETGEIKAISNIEKLKDGTYGEALNRAVLPYEPGSVMKPISLLIALEDGLVKNINERVDCSPFQKTKDPHAPSVKDMKQVIEMSSNTGIARVIFRGYGADPSKFYDRLESIGFFEPFHSGIAGECTPRIRKLLPKDSKGHNITMTARHLDLARQAYGYNTEIPPLYTLSIYNAIANNGKYVRPHLVKALRYEDGHDSIIPPGYVRERICSEEHARMLRECIREVVWGSHGTARAVRDDRVEIAGKTGTVFPVGKGGYDRSKRRLAFAGFFPYDSPKYSCMALVLCNAGNGAGTTSGLVVKNMAVKMYSKGWLDNSSTYTDSKVSDKPVFVATDNNTASGLAKDLNVNKYTQVVANTPGSRSTVPDVSGLDAPSAVRVLEKAGLNVKIKGTGYVYAQSIPKGDKIIPNSEITIYLKI